VPRPPPRPRARAAPPAPVPAPARQLPPVSARALRRPWWRTRDALSAGLPAWEQLGGRCHPAAIWSGLTIRWAHRAARPAAARAQRPTRALPRAGRQPPQTGPRRAAASRVLLLAAVAGAPPAAAARMKRGRAPGRPRRAARPVAARPRPAARRAGAARASAGRPPRRRPPRPAASPRPACAPRWAAPLALRAAPHAHWQHRGSAPTRAGHRSRQAPRQQHRRQPRRAGRAGERGADARTCGGRRRRAQHRPERLRGQAAQVGRTRGAQPRGRGQQPRRVGRQRTQQRAAHARRGRKHLPGHLRLPLAACARPRSQLSLLAQRRCSGARRRPRACWQRAGRGLRTVRARTRTGPSWRTTSTCKPLSIVPVRSALAFSFTSAAAAAAPTAATTFKRPPMPPSKQRAGSGKKFVTLAAESAAPVGCAERARRRRAARAFVQHVGQRGHGARQVRQKVCLQVARERLQQRQRALQRHLRLPADRAQDDVRHARLRPPARRRPSG